MDYHCYGYGNLRDYPLADNKYGLEQLIARYSFIDGTKVGIFGHSGGGSMTVAAICTYPDFYKAAVASSGNYDNTIFDYGWSEIHHGIKEVTKEGKVRIFNTSPFRVGEEFERAFDVSYGRCG